MKWINYIIITFFIIFSTPALANAASDDGHEEDGFNTVEFIFHHVNDSHEWFFFSIGDKHYSIPLPVILKSEHTGWHVFSSNKLYHHPDGFNFHLAHGGENDGKIVEKLADGSEYIPFDISLTKSVLGAIIVSLILCIVFIRGARRAKKNKGKAPKGIQNVVEPLVVFIRDEVAKPFAGPKYKRYIPFLLTLFTFVLLANLIGLILPLGLNVTGNIAVTLVLAGFTFIITTISGNKHYWKHIFNPDVPWYMKTPVVPLMQLIEFSGILIKPIVLMIRLFANMLAGHMIISVLIALIFLMSSVLHPAVGAGTSLISIAFSIFMLLLDLLVSFIQAYIFTLLSAMYFGMATDDGH
jgi:F-type H+-transporting ATPase subunit a